jgi:acyl carrier protein
MDTGTHASTGTDTGTRSGTRTSADPQSGTGPGEAGRAERRTRIRDVAAAVFSADPAAVEAATDFEHDLDADSLLAVEFVVELEKALGVPLAVEQIPRLMSGLDRAYDEIARTAGW